MPMIDPRAEMPTIVESSCRNQTSAPTPSPTLSFSPGGLLAGLDAILAAATAPPSGVPGDTWARLTVVASEASRLRVTAAEVLETRGDGHQEAALRLALETAHANVNRLRAHRNRLHMELTMLKSVPESDSGLGPDQPTRLTQGLQLILATARNTTPADPAIRLRLIADEALRLLPYATASDPEISVRSDDRTTPDQGS